MVLKIKLKPGERFILGQSVITNGEHGATLIVEGGEPILREKDIMRPGDADTPCKQLYLAIQLLYLSNQVEKPHETYFALAGEIAAAAPSTAPTLHRIDNLILTGAYYKGLKEAKALIAYEGELLNHAKRR